MINLKQEYTEEDINNIKCPFCCNIILRNYINKEGSVHYGVARCPNCQLILNFNLLSNDFYHIKRFFIIINDLLLDCALFEDKIVVYCNYQRIFTFNRPDMLDDDLVNELKCHIIFK